MLDQSGAIFAVKDEPPLQWWCKMIVIRKTAMVNAVSHWKRKENVEGVKCFKTYQVDEYPGGYTSEY